MEENTKHAAKSRMRTVALTVTAVLTIVTAVNLWVLYEVTRAGAHARYMGVKNLTAERIAKIIRGAEMNANNIFDEVQKSLDSPENVIAALKSKADLNLDVRGYFAAFVPDYFPEKGSWFEPYIYQPEYGGFDYRQVGTARHNYTKSPWYVRAKETGGRFWSEPYYYYDGTSMSGHYSTYVRPIYNAQGKLACVCGADMKFEWLSKELKWADERSKTNKLMNKYRTDKNLGYYTVILDSNGVCIAHPEEKEMAVTDEDVIKDLRHRKGGVADLGVDGEACTVFYGPIEFINWSVAVIVPKQDIVRPVLPAVALLLAMAVVGVLIIWVICRRR